MPSYDALDQGLLIDAKTNEFADALTELCMKYGLGVEGATVYVIEPEDRLHRYQIDDESKLVRV